MTRHGQDEWDDACKGVCVATQTLCVCDAPATRVMSAPWELFDHGMNDRSSLENPHQSQSLATRSMSSLDGDNMETTQELALMVVCTMMSQLDDDDRNALAQEIIDSGGVPHLIKAMFGSNTAVAASAKETLIRICETAA